MASDYISTQQKIFDLQLLGYERHEVLNYNKLSLFAPSK